jgi:CDP-diacylglycerol--glycerol-3-phosphate 3-phosphatidyltransferase
MRWTVPNAVSLSRLLLAAAFGYLLFTDHGRVTLLVVFALAALSDALDGAVARGLGQVTHEGAVLDQFVDRIFTAAIVLLLLVHPLAAERPLLLLACARELVALPGVGIALARGKRLYHVERLGKVATFVQSVTLAVIIAGVPWAPHLAVVCAVTGVAAALNYIRYSLGPVDA